MIRKIWNRFSRFILVKNANTLSGEMLQNYKRIHVQVFIISCEQSFRPRAPYSFPLRGHERTRARMCLAFSSAIYLVFTTAWKVFHAETGRG